MGSSLHAASERPPGGGSQHQNLQNPSRQAGAVKGSWGRPLAALEDRVSQDVSAEVLILDDIGQLLLHVGGIYAHGFLFQVRPLKRNLVQEFFHNGMQPSCSDVFGGFVHRRGKLGDFLERFIGEGQLDAFRLEQRDILLYQRALGLLQDADKIFRSQRRVHEVTLVK